MSLHRSLACLLLLVAACDSHVVAEEPHDAGAVLVGATRVDTLRFRNTGLDTATLSPLTITGDGFALGGTTCGATLAPSGGTCELAIVFTPTAIGPVTGAVHVLVDGIETTAPLKGAGAWRLALSITGTGSVTSSPAGIQCAAPGCHALFVDDTVTLTASGSGDRVWTFPGCTGSTCTVSAPTTGSSRHGAVAIGVVTTQLQLDLEETGVEGSVYIRSESLSFEQVCTDDCTFSIPVGETYRVSASSPSTKRAILSGACAGTGGCSFVAQAQPYTMKATFGLDLAMGEQWAITLPEQLTHAAHDGSANLVVSGTATLYKLSPTGTLLWSQPQVVKSLATGPADTIYLHTGTTIVKLDAAGTQLWTVPLPTGVQGCTSGVQYARRTLAVGPAGEVAVIGTALLGRWDSAGTPTWTVPLSSWSQCAVIIEDDGVVSNTVEGSDNESGVQQRTSAAGVPLPEIPNICRQYLNMLYVNLEGEVECTSSGHSWVYGFSSIHLPIASFVPSAIVSNAAGDLGWMFHDNDFNDSWQFQRAGAHPNAIHGGLQTLWTSMIGTFPRDIAGGAGTQAFALVGEYWGVNTIGGWVSSYVP